MPAPTPDEMRRLALIRHLHDIGVAQARGPETVVSLALLPLHDAVDMFLQLACEHYNVGQKNTEFMAHFDLLEKVPLTLKGKEPMRRFNRARVNLKHGGVLIASAEVEGFRNSVTGFLNANCLICFDLEFDEISMSALIQSAEVRNRVILAENHLAQGDAEEALTETAIAFEELMRLYVQDKGRYGEEYSLRRAALSGSSLPSSHHLTNSVGGAIGRELRNLERAILTSASVFSEAITLLDRGVDLSRYALFRTRMPEIVGLGGSSYQVNLHETPPPADIIRECISFVTDTAIRVQG